MKLVIEIPDGYDVTSIQNGSIASKVVLNAVKNGTPHETVTEFADRCRECGREKVLDKIKAEITNIPLTDTDGNNGHWHREPQAIINDVLQVIDKYKGERGE